MASTINGNVGGSAFSAAQVQLLNLLTNVITFAAVDGSGNYTFGSLSAGIYQIRATIASNFYYHPIQITVDGSSTYNSLNLNPTALSADNSRLGAGF